MVEFARFFADEPVDQSKLPKPRPLNEEERADPYPVAALPPLIRDAIIEVASYVQAPDAMIAASALAAVSTAVQTGFSVSRNSALIGPATLYLLTVADSGERKSTVDKLFTAPIRDWEAQQRKDFRERRARFEAALEDWKRQGDDLNRNIESGFLADQLGTDLDPRVIHQLAEPKEPKRVRILRGDDTPEALASALEAYPIASIISAEAGTIFGSHGMNPEAVTRNLAQANVMWDGGVIQRGRIGTGELQVEGMRVTMGLQVQPKVLDAFVQKTGGLAKGIGYFARFLFSRPESTQGTRYYVEPPELQPALAAFWNRMTTLLAVEAEFDDYDRLAPKVLGFDADAQRAWIAFHDEVEEKQGADFEYFGIRDVASKAADNAARLACCLHVFAGDPDLPIGRWSVESANSLMRWYLDEAVRFSGTANAAPEIADAQALEEWLVRETHKRARSGADLKVPVNHARRTGPSMLRKAKSQRLNDAVEILADYHRIFVTGRVGKKGHDMMLRADVFAEYSR